MKKSILIVLFNFLVVGIWGQNFFMYVDGKKHSYEFSTTKLLVKSNMLNATGIKNVIQLNKMVPVDSIITLDEGLFMVNIKNENKETVLELVNRWNIREDVTFSSEVLIDEIGNEIGGVTNQVLVRLKSKADYSVLLQSLIPYDVKDVKPCNFDERTYLVTVNKNLGKSPMQIANELFETDLFDYAEPNLIHFLKLSTNDTYFLQQWGLNNTGQSGGTSGIDIKANQAWGITTGSSNVRIAILDVGVDLTHPDLQGNLLTGFDATGSGGIGGPLNNIAHGTACAGIAAALGNNSEGIAGVAYGSRILPVSVASTTTNWTTTESGYIASGIDWARQNNASVISMSFGCIETTALNTEITEASTLGRNNLGCVFVAASGNSNLSTIDYPSSNPNVIAVGAIKNNGNRANFSNYGTSLNLVAPGENIYTTDIQGSTGYNTSNGIAGNYYSGFTGTSAACPHVAGISALILSVRPDLTRTQALQAIESNCTKLSAYSFSNNSSHPNGTWNNQVGHGLVNAFAAVNSVAPAISSISPSVICSFGSTFSVSNLPVVDSIIWSVGPYLALNSGQYTNSPTIKATGSGNSWVKVRLVNSYGNFILPQKAVWAGMPDNSQIDMMVMYGQSPGNILCTNTEQIIAAGHPNAQQQGIESYYWDFGSWAPYHTGYDLGGITNSRPTFYLSWYPPTSQVIKVAAHNQCSHSMTYAKSKTFYAQNCFGLRLVFSPNPATDETTMNIETTSTEESVDPAAEWEMEVYSPTQNLKEKQTNLKGKSAKIQTAGWQEGVYVVRVKYNNEILTGKLVVKK